MKSRFGLDKVSSIARSYFRPDLINGLPEPVQVLIGDPSNRRILILVASLLLLSPFLVPGLFSVLDLFSSFRKPSSPPTPTPAPLMSRQVMRPNHPLDYDERNIPDELSRIDDEIQGLRIGVSEKYREYDADIQELALKEGARQLAAREASLRSELNLKRKRELELARQREEERRIAFCSELASEEARTSDVIRKGEIRDLFKKERCLEGAVF